MKIFGLEFHHDRDPWRHAPPWAIELRQMLVRLLANSEVTLEDVEEIEDDVQPDVLSLTFTLEQEPNMPIISITLAPGGALVHVTVTDQNGVALDPTQITWDLSALPGAAATADATGFNFDAPAGTADVTANAIATYSGPRASAPVPGDLSVAIEIVVTSLGFESP
jgi:hypothetical protein